jgi:hypothetical protein
MRRRLSIASSLLLGLLLSIASAAVALADGPRGPYPS